MVRSLDPKFMHNTKGALNPRAKRNRGTNQDYSDASAAIKRENERHWRTALFLSQAPYY